MSPRERLLIVFAAVGAVLLGATVLVAVMRGRQPDRDLRELELRVRTWWLMIGVFFGALLWDDRAALGLWALICFLALKEFLSLVPFRHQARRLMFWCYLAIPLQFVWVSMAWYLLFIIFIPVYLFLALPVRAVMLGHTEDYVRTVATLPRNPAARARSRSTARYRRRPDQNIDDEHRYRRRVRQSARKRTGAVQRNDRKISLTLRRPKTAWSCLHQY